MSTVKEKERERAKKKKDHGGINDSIFRPRFSHFTWWVERAVKIRESTNRPRIYYHRRIIVIIKVKRHRDLAIGVQLNRLYIWYFGGQSDPCRSESVGQTRHGPIALFHRRYRVSIISSFHWPLIESYFQGPPCFVRGWLFKNQREGGIWNAFMWCPLKYLWLIRGWWQGFTRWQYRFCINVEIVHHPPVVVD